MILYFIYIILIIILTILLYPFLLIFGSERLDTKVGQYEPAKKISKHDAINLEYPYKNLYMSEKKVEESFELIKKSELKLVRAKYTIKNIPQLTSSDLCYEGQSIVCELNENDYWKMDWVSDWFNESCRLKCRRYDEDMSPFDYWGKNRYVIVDSVKDLTHRNLSDEVYKHIRGCGTFRPGLMRGMIAKFGAKSVLDFSSGWGDRLIGALAAGVRYVGVDPNPCVHVGYEKIIKKFSSSKNMYTMIQAPFQSANLPSVGDNLETYDLVFTSPPYFDLEVYSSESSQSIADFPGQNDWFENFLMVSIRKSWDLLNDYGHMVIIINNIRGREDFVMKMIKRVESFVDAKYLGVIVYADKSRHGKYRSPQPMWIWEKIGCEFFSEEVISRISVQNIEQFVQKYGGQVVIGGEWESIEDDNCWYLLPNFSEIINSREDSVYYGSILLGKIKYFVWKKKTLELNPKIVIENIQKNKNITLRVVRDDLLPGGTKQRAHNVIGRINNNEIVYAGPWTGFAQVAIAISCKIHKKCATLFLNKDNHTTNIRARMYGAKIKVLPNATLKELQAAAMEYAAATSAYYMPFGFDSPEFRDELFVNISDAINGILNKNITENIWMVAGSGTLLNVLYKVFPSAKFNVVQVGKKIWDDQMDLTRTKLYVAPEKFYETANILPPYKSVDKYDAKLWQYVIADGADNDIIWNVAG